jgi:hypothetical protein
MFEYILVNNTSNDIYVSDLNNLLIPANSASVKADLFGAALMQASVDLVNLFRNDVLAINNGASVLHGDSAIAYIRADHAQLITDQPLEAVTYHSSRGDDLVNNVVGSGAAFEFNVSPNDYQIVDLQFLPGTRIKGGTVLYQDAVLGSSICLQVICPAGYPYPADPPNTGAFDVVDGSVIPNVTNNGAYDINPNAETVVHRFLYHYMLLGDGSFSIVSERSYEIPSVYKVRGCVQNVSSSQNLKLVANLLLYKTKTV